MIAKSNKKGFTIIELVITISVIGVLAAILVPTFISLVQKANERSDDSLVTNLNKALAIHEHTVGDKPNDTYQDAIDDLKDEGFIADVLATKSDKTLLWCSKDNRFHLESNGVVEGAPAGATDLEFWGVYNAMPTTQKYSIYAGPSWSEVNTTVSGLTVGFDVGDHDFFTSVSYDRSSATVGQSVVIRTNSAATSLTVNAPLDVVAHYGSVGSVDIKAVASSSYHENGSAAFLEVANGRVALEQNAEVTQIHLVATAGNFNNITVAKAATVEMPRFSRDPVEIPEEGKLVVALQDSVEASSEKEYVWLTAIGVYEQVTVSASSEAAGTTYATSESVSSEKKSAAAQIANNITFSAGNEDYKVVATKTNQGWSYEVKTSAGASTTYTATESAGVVTVKDSTEAPVETASENGLDEAAKEAVKEAVVEETISEEVASETEYHYVARIGTTGYETLQAAVRAAKPGEKITLFEDIDLESSIGVANSNDPDVYPYELTNIGAVKGALRNEIVLTKDVSIRFVNGSKLYLGYGGSINFNGHNLTLDAGDGSNSYLGGGIERNQSLYGLEDVYSIDGNTLTFYGKKLDKLVFEYDLYQWINFVVGEDDYGHDYTGWCASGNVVIGVHDMYMGSGKAPSEDTIYLNSRYMPRFNDDPTYKYSYGGYRPLWLTASVASDDEDDWGIWGDVEIDSAIPSLGRINRLGGPGFGPSLGGGSSAVDYDFTWSYEVSEGSDVTLSLITADNLNTYVNANNGFKETFSQGMINVDVDPTDYHYFDHVMNVKFAVFGSSGYNMKDEDVILDITGGTGEVTITATGTAEDAEDVICTWTIYVF